MQQKPLNKKETKSPLDEEQPPKRLKYLPSIISVQRLAVLPPLLLSLEYGLVLVGYALFLFAISTDFADGYLARKLHATTKSGALLDATVDFLFILGMLLSFVAKGFYPLLLLFPIVLVYAQFILTSLFSKVVYDPVGKYYGSFLYGAIGLTLFFPRPPIYAMVTAGILAATAASLLSRLMYLVRAGRSKQRHRR